MKHRYLVGSLYAIFATVAVGASVAALTLLARYPYLTGQAARYGIGALTLFAFLRYGGEPLPRLHWRDLVRLIVLALTGLVGFNLCLLWALERAEPAAVSVIVGCTPIVLAFIGPILERRAPQRRVLFAAVVVTVGAAIVEGAGSATLSGLVFAFGALVGEASFSLLARPLLARLRPVALSAYVCAIASLVLSVTAVGIGGATAFPFPTPTELMAILFLGFVVTAGAFVAWYTSIMQLGIERAGLFLGIIPLSAVACTALIGTGTITPLRLLGTSVVAIGVVTGLYRPGMLNTSRPRLS